MNMRTAYLSMGAAETCLISSGEMALAKYYGLPTTRMGGYSDSQWPDVQAGIEKAMAILILAQSDADFVTMGGPLDNAAHHSYEQVVIDHDIWEMAQRLTQRDRGRRRHPGLRRHREGRAPAARSSARRTRGAPCRPASTTTAVRSTTPGASARSTRCWRGPTQRVEEILARPFEYGAPPAAVRRIKDYVRDHATAKGVAPPEWTE